MTSILKKYSTKPHVLSILLKGKFAPSWRTVAALCSYRVCQSLMVIQHGKKSCQTSRGKSETSPAEWPRSVWSTCHISTKIWLITQLPSLQGLTVYMCCSWPRLNYQPGKTGNSVRPRAPEGCRSTGCYCNWFVVNRLTICVWNCTITAEHLPAGWGPSGGWGARSPCPEEGSSIKRTYFNFVFSSKAGDS